MGERRDCRAAAPVLGHVLLVAVVLILASTAALVGTGFTDDLREPGPYVSGATGELVAGGTEQVVKITHRGGDPVPVDEVEIVVDASRTCGKTSRIVDIPTDTLGTGNYEGDDIFDYFSPDAGELQTNGDGTWSVGETIQFRLASTECPLEPGDPVEVRVVHLPSNSVVLDEELTAE